MERLGSEPTEGKDVINPIKVGGSLVSPVQPEPSIILSSKSGLGPRGSTPRRMRGATRPIMDAVAQTRPCGAGLDGQVGRHVSAACSANGPVGRYVAEDHSRNALLLDDRPAEDKIIADGYGVVRLDAMYDDFVIVGPIFDPAGTLGLNDTSKAFAQIAATGALSAIRGDDSSTDRLELRLWRSTGAEPDKQAAWYRDVAQGLKEKLNLAAAMNAYTLTDRATWANFKKPPKFLKS